MTRRSNDFAIGAETGLVLDAAHPGPTTILDLAKGGCLNPSSTGRYGLAQIHLDVYDVDILPFSEAARSNAMLLVDCTYTTAGAGGEFTFDATRGRILSVGAVDSIKLAARLVPAIDGELLNLYATKRLTCTVHWPGTISPKEIDLSLPSVNLAVVDAAPVPSAFFKIPRQAESVLVYSPEPAKFPTLMLEFFSSDAAGSLSRYGILDPFANGAKITHGVEFFRFRQTAAVTQQVFADFTLVP